MIKEKSGISEEKPKARITPEFMKQLLRSDLKLYYMTPSLNDVLYLHFKGFEGIENLQEFVNLKVLYLEGNCIEVIHGLHEQKELKCLYLHQNLIE
jgi:dynein assembly factor 1